MLTADLVRVRRRGGTITVAPLRPAELARLKRAAKQYVVLASEHVGLTRGELETALCAVQEKSTDYKLMRGLRKLLCDRCTFAVREDIDPLRLRKTVFVAAAQARRALGPEQRFDRDAVLASAATGLGLSADEADALLYADLKENQRITHFDPLTGPELLKRYELGQVQAVLLRASSVTVTLRCSAAAGYRLFFNRLKFRRLLHHSERLSDGRYRVKLDGPLSLFRSVTKYGLALALMLPILDETGAWELEAQILWGKDRKPYRFHLEAEPGTPTPSDGPPLADEVAELLRSFERLKSPWQVVPSDEIFELPGVGVCVPDLTFTHRSGRATTVHLEVMGYWSRDAVWRRVELVQAGLRTPLIFAVSDRLRVSEAALNSDLPASILTYKGIIAASTVLARLEMLQSNIAPLDMVHRTI